MNIDKSQALVVLVGAFNTLILRDPNWIKGFLFPDSKQEIEIKVKFDIQAEKITSMVEVDGIQVEVKAGRISITPKNNSQKYVDQVYKLVKNISVNLPHTPMIAYGVNFGFTGKSSKSLLWRRNSVFMDCDDKILEFKQVLQRDGYLINFFISEKKMTDKKYEERLVFNFHVPVNSIASLEDLIQNKKIEQFRKIAQEHAEKVLATNTEA